MSKRKMTLEEAKKILETDKVFYNGENKFNVVDSGKYKSGFTIVIPQEWDLGKNGVPEKPIQYRKCEEILSGMNIDFNGDANVLLGKFRMSQNGRPVFEITEPSKAKDTLIKVGWGGAFNKTRGREKRFANKAGATYFVEKHSNGGKTGNDYWVVPVGFVRDRQERDVSNILAGIQKKDDERRKKIDEYLEEQERERKDSIENRERILSQIQPIVEQIKLYRQNFECQFNEDKFVYQKIETRRTVEKRYTNELVEELNEILKIVLKEKAQKDEYLPKFEEMEDTIDLIGLKIIYYDRYAQLDLPTAAFGSKTYIYNSDDYNVFVNDLMEYKEKIEKEQEEARKKAEELKKATQLKKQKEEANKMGYPELFEFYNRLGGATGLSHAYVFESDGEIREPDYNNLNNNNHKCKYKDWKNEADGTQGYMQLLPGEVIITYTRNHKSLPYNINIEWADGELTKQQLYSICEEFSEISPLAVDVNEEEITDFKQWLIEKVKLKANECRKQLQFETENEKEEARFVEEIVGYAKRKAIEEDRNNQAKQLAQAYEQQLSKQEETLGDE